MIHDVSGAPIWTVAGVVAVAMSLALQALYFALANVPEFPDYSAVNSPFTAS